MPPCHPDFAILAQLLGGGGIDCRTASPWVSVRSPFALTSWTQPVLELLIVAGALVALIHAVLWWRRRGDPSNLGLWCATVVYVLVLEPPLYFPDRFGLDDQVGLIFAHNLFTVQFLYDRLPLYIVAFYPALTYLAYALVQRTGVLDRRHPLVGAACVAFVFHLGYEIFDQIGPGLRWWAWNPSAPSNTPLIGDAPVSSAVLFAAAAPFGTALLARLLLSPVSVARIRAIPTAELDLGGRGWSVVGRTVAVGVLSPVAMIVFSLPARPFGVTGGAVVQWLELGALAAVALTALVPTLVAGEGRRGGGFLRWYAPVAGAVYLATFAGLWLTAADAPATAVAYAAVCALLWLAVLAARPGSTVPAPTVKGSTVARESTVD